LADRIAYHRSYLSQVERGRQVPAEQFAMLCDQALEAGGRLMGVFRELAVEREVRRREVAVERWRERFRVVQGSDRLVDALVAWGDVEAVSRRVKDHLDAGADHVCIKAFDAEPHDLPLRQWRTLAMAML
jgi:hypothetical protein